MYPANRIVGVKLSWFAGTSEATKHDIEEGGLAQAVDASDYSNSRQERVVDSLLIAAWEELVLLDFETLQYRKSDLGKCHCTLRKIFETQL